MKDILQQPAIVALSNLFERINSGVTNPIRITSNKQLVIGGLCQKILSNCNAIILLAKDGFLAEASMIMRGTYETVIIAHYLLHNEAEIKHYQNHSQIVEYKDYLLAYSRTHHSEKASFGESIEGIKQHILSSKLLDESRYFKRRKPLTASMLDDPKALASALNSVFCPIWDMKQRLKEQDEYVYNLLNDLSLSTYNYGSQLLHSYWHCIDEYYLKDEKPFINLPQIILYIVVCLDCMVRAMESTHLLNTSRAKLEPAFEEIGKELSKILPKPTQIQAL